MFSSTTSTTESITAIILTIVKEVRSNPLIHKSAMVTITPNEELPKAFMRAIVYVLFAEIFSSLFLETDANTIGSALIFLKVSIKQTTQVIMVSIVQIIGFIIIRSKKLLNGLF